MILIFIHSEHLNGFILPLPFHGDQTGIWGRSTVLTKHNILSLQIIQMFISFHHSNNSYLLIDKYVKATPKKKISFGNNPHHKKSKFF